MPTARELLEQADALMRRNRGGDANIPLLTEHVSDALGEPLRGPSTRERAASRVSHGTGNDAANAEAEDLTLALDRSLQNGVEPPMLTDVVEEVAVDLVPLPSARSEEDWLGPDTVDPELHSITGPSPDTVAHVPPVTLRSLAPSAAEPVEVAEEALPPRVPPEVEEAPAPQTASPEVEEARAPATVSPEAGEATAGGAAVPPELRPVPVASDDERWRALAEQVSMQVLQRLDLFVDTGL